MEDVSLATAPGLRELSAMIAWIAQSVVDLLILEAERFFPNETGGTLIGYWSTTDREVVVASCTTSGPLARHTSTQYSPDVEHDEQAVAQHYRASGNMHSYLGDWHTHPAGIPHLSSKDHATLECIARSKEARIPTPLMAVLGGKPSDWLLQIWRYKHQRLGRRTKSLQLRTY